ncbi:MAG: YchJ family metal-binding protein [Bdellovibrionota bacterium]
MKRTKLDNAMLCYCGSQKKFETCCEPLLTRSQAATSAESLMRSRYAAFCTKDMDYLFETTHPSARASFDRESNTTWAEQAHFEKLEVLGASQMGDRGFVNFKAHFTIDGVAQVHREASSFRRENGIWYFVDGKVS